MKAAVLKKDGKLHIMEVPRPVPAHGQVLMKVRACGICGSDLRYLEGENPWSQQTLGYQTENPDNMILGHEFSGEIVETADEKDRHLIGRKAAVIAYKGCGSCEFCRTGRMNLCKNTAHLGHGAGWGEMEYYPGGMAEYCQVWSDHVYPFEHVSFEEASTLDFVTVGMAAVAKADKIFAEDAVVIGTGPVGLAIVQLLKLQGARRVFCVDRIDYAFRAAAEMGADRTFFMGEYEGRINELAEDIRRAAGGTGAASVFDTAGTGETQRLSLAVLKGRGTVVNLVGNEERADYRLQDFSRERSVVSVANAADCYFYDCLKMLEAGRLNVKPLLTDILPLSQAEEGFQRLKDRENTKAIKVILKP